MALTDIEIRQAKPRDAAFKLSDSGGLFLLITPSGGKLWRLKYRLLGREKLLSLGPYPTVSLADARTQRDAAKKLLLDGLDPNNEKRAERRRQENAEADTFGLIAEEFIHRETKAGKAAATTAKARWLLLDLAAKLKDRPISQITAPEVLQVLRIIEGRGNRESATRCRSAISRVFRYAIVTSRATVDPTQALRGALLPPQVTHHAALTRPEQVGGLLLSIHSLENAPIIQRALSLLALCFPRPGELRHAQWAEIDLDKATWSISARVAKMRRAHLIPLSRQAVELFRELHTLTGHRKLVFPGYRTPNRPISDNSLTAALRRLGYSGDEMCAHGFRTTASTLLNESGRWNPDAIERALAHTDANSVRKAYARGTYWDERVKMSQWWADHLDELRNCALSQGQGPT
jgi:integrase